MAFGAQDLAQLKILQRSSNTNITKISDELGMLLEDLTALTTAERAVFVSFVLVLFVLSMCGNIGTLHVNFRRKIRPFFRACLISLAISDLISTTFMTTAYMAEFTAHYVQEWRIGDTMCSLVPFITTVAILASSLTLVGIAVDRYFAVMRATIGCWNPGFIFCVVCMLVIWVASLCIAAPVYFVYDLYPVSVLSEENNTTVATPKPVAGKSLLMTGDKNFALNSSPSSMESSDADSSSEDAVSFTLVETLEVIPMCISNQRSVAPYYLVVFGIIFVPCIVAFIWLNCIIAKKILVRRKPLCASKTTRTTTSNRPTDSHKGQNTNCRPCNQNPNATNNSLIYSLQLLQTNNFDLEMERIAEEVTQQPYCCPRHNYNVQQAAQNTKPSKKENHSESRIKTNSARESRHIRMFTIIILMVAVFLFFRLPAWIFLIMRMYGSQSSSTDWILYFSFGVLNLASCVLNPLFYTFLTETIQYAMLIKVKICDSMCGLRICWELHQQRRNSITVSTKSKNKSKVEEMHGVAEGSPPVKQVKGHCCHCWHAPFISFHANFHFDKSEAQQDQQQVQLNQLRTELPEHVCLKKEPIQNQNNERDEGVECSDESDVDENIDEFGHAVGGGSCEQNQVFTIFSTNFACRQLQ